MSRRSPDRRRALPGACSAILALSLVVASLASASAPAGASVASDQTDIARLEHEIAAQGTRAQELVSRYNEVQTNLNALDAQIVHDESIIAADQAAAVAALGALRRLAIKAYVSGSGMDSPALQMFSGTSNVTTMLEQNQYLGAVNNKLGDAITRLELAQGRTKDDQTALLAKQAQAKSTLAQLATARDAATAAIASDEAKLLGVKGDLRALVAAANARRHAQQAAAERALASALRSARSEAPRPLPTPTPSPSPTPTPTSGPPPVGSPTPPPPPASSPGSYANPFRGAIALSAERIDQGVDYVGFGPIYAIGNGVVLSTVGSGWPGGTFIAYRLTDGPAAGLVVFVAEDVQSSVQVGATVTSNSVLGQMFAGPSGIETGWADGSSLPDTMARTYGQFDGSNPTAFGYNFSRLLQALGAPAGISSGPPSGVLPASWPTW